MDINRDAPVIGAADLDVAATPETVWRLLVDVERWPTWNPEIKAVRIDGTLAEGSQFRWKAGPGWITSTLRDVEPPHVLGWTGTTFTIKAVHVYRLTPIEGGTRVHTEESWEGFLARRLARSFSKQLQQRLQSGLAHLKEVAEKTRTGSTTRAAR